tara:strand:+ start:102 stop:521 length:420 start_codon:yes stop_codon:yes gene_type:complete
MIVFKLNCQDCYFEYEGWFESSKEFDKQKRKKIIICPSCEGININKSLMAPNIGKKTNLKRLKDAKKTVINKIEKYKKIIETNFDYVGDNFTEEAKKIKYGEADERPIYGEANLEQTKELLEEEISVMPLPWTPTKKTN